MGNFVHHRREHILQEIEKEKVTNQEEEVIEDFGDGYFAQYQRGLYSFYLADFKDIFCRFFVNQKNVIIWMFWLKVFSKWYLSLRKYNISLRVTFQNISFRLIRNLMFVRLIWSWILLQHKRIFSNYFCKLRIFYWLEKSKTMLKSAWIILHIK